MKKIVITSVLMGSLIIPQTMGSINANNINSSSSSINNSAMSVLSSSSNSSLTYSSSSHISPSSSGDHSTTSWKCDFNNNFGNVTIESPSSMNPNPPVVAPKDYANLKSGYLSFNGNVYFNDQESYAPTSITYKLPKGLVLAERTYEIIRGSGIAKDWDTGFPRYYPLYMGTICGEKGANTIEVNLKGYTPTPRYDEVSLGYVSTLLKVVGENQMVSSSTSSSVKNSSHSNSSKSLSIKSSSSKTASSAVSSSKVSSIRHIAQLPSERPAISAQYASVHHAIQKSKKTCECKPQDSNKHNDVSKSSNKVQSQSSSVLSSSKQLSSQNSKASNNNKQNKQDDVVVKGTKQNNESNQVQGNNTTLPETGTKPFNMFEFLIDLFK